MKGPLHMPAETREDHIWKLLEGEVDILTPAAAQDRDALRRLSCPKCGGGEITSEVDARRPFVAHSLLANWNGRCQTCKCLFSSTTGIIIEG